MIDAPGPWASGAFVLVEGRSVVATERVVTDGTDCTWLQTQERTPTVRLRANPHYWDHRRGPRLSEIEFRNDLTPAQALDLVCDTVGEVDIVTEVPAAVARRVEQSRHAQLVPVDAVRVLAGVFNRGADGVPLADRRARRALNLAIDRSALVREGFDGYARPLHGLTPPTPLTGLHRLPGRLRGYRHDPDAARRLWAEAGGALRPLRLATLPSWQDAAAAVAAQWRHTLDLAVEVTVLDGDQEYQVRRQLAAEHSAAWDNQAADWDVLLLDHGSQSVDVPPLELHRAFVGRSGEFRAGPVDQRFERLFAGLRSRTSQVGQVLAANRIDSYVTREALALFLVAPQTLYAVNRHVRFVGYATTFELTDTSVSRRHWSRRRGFGPSAREDDRG